ncbi:hypothetical protein [Streptomyces sp. NPDC021356]|uniref:hypothetical protein n=1 Tax=Streptomyces sp. NPDC021356 TaxID=3154900 RepID=UPI0033FA538F
MRARRTALVAAALLVGLTAGCAGRTAATPRPAPSATPSASVSGSAATAASSGYADMRKKVDAAQSALAAADRDATSGVDR